MSCNISLYFNRQTLIGKTMHTFWYLKKLIFSRKYGKDVIQIFRNYLSEYFIKKKLEFHIFFRYLMFLLCIKILYIFKLGRMVFHSSQTMQIKIKITASVFIKLYYIYRTHYIININSSLCNIFNRESNQMPNECDGWISTVLSSFKKNFKFSNTYIFLNKI